MNTKTNADTAPARGQHTPGPWYASDGSYHLGQREFIGIGNGAAHVGYASVTCAVRMAEAKANARLIAAAPALLEALKQIVAALTQPVQFTHSSTPGTAEILRGDAIFAVKSARAALALAEGADK